MDNILALLRDITDEDNPELSCEVLLPGTKRIAQLVKLGEVLVIWYDDVNHNR